MGGERGGWNVEEEEERARRDGGEGGGRVKGPSEFFFLQKFIHFGEKGLPLATHRT